MGYGVWSEKFGHKNAIKHEKGGHLDWFSYNSKYPLKRIWQKPLGPPWISNNCASMKKSQMMTFYPKLVQTKLPGEWWEGKMASDWGCSKQRLRNELFGCPSFWFWRRTTARSDVDVINSFPMTFWDELLKWYYLIVKCYIIFNQVFNDVYTI